MKIKIAMLEEDINYLERIVAVFNTKYCDKLEIYSFTKIENAMEAVFDKKIDVFIANEKFDIDVEKLPKRCSFAYFADAVGIETIKNEKAISKYQKIELIYKQILSIYSERATMFSGKINNDSNVNIIMFTSFSGGVGASSMAAAFALKLAKERKKVLYLNLERMGDSEQFFKGEGQFTYSDVIYALKSKKSNLMLKIESSVKQSLEGVDYFAAPQVALDMLELKTEEVTLLIEGIVAMGKYEYLVVDTDEVFSDLGKMLWSMAHGVVVVSDGSEIANAKFERTYNSLEVINDKNERDYRLEKAMLVYNKFSNKTSKTIEGINISEIGGIPKYEHATVGEIIHNISAMTVFNNLIS